MSIFIWTAGLLVFGLLALVLLLLSIPWVATIFAGTESEQRLSVELRPFSSLFPARLRFDALPADRNADTTKHEENAKRDRGPEQPGKTARSGRRTRARALRMLRAAPRLLGGLLSVFRIERLRLRGKVGLDDPADTGTFLGALMPLCFILPAPRFSIELQPEFGGATFDGEAELRLRMVPIRIVPPAARFAWQVFVSPR